MTLNNQFVSDRISDCNCDSCVESRKQASNVGWVRSLAGTMPELEVLVFSQNDTPTLVKLAAAYRLPTAYAYGYGVDSGVLTAVPFYYEPDYWFDGVGWYVKVRSAGICDVCGLHAYHRIDYGKYSVHTACMNYTTANTMEMGNVVKLPEFSFEFEMSRQEYGSVYDEGIIELLQKKFTRVGDGTVSDEMLSPIYHSDKDFFDVLPVLDDSSRFVDEHCGTHIHVGITQYPKLWYQDRGMDIVSRLGRYIDDSPYTSQIWGRECSRWCEPIYQGDRYVWLNVYSHWNTVEFRLPRYRNAKQFKNIVRYCRFLTYDMRKVYNEHLRRSCSLDNWSVEEAATHFLDQYARFEKTAMKGKQYDV